MVYYRGQVLSAPATPHCLKEQIMTPRKSVPPPSGCICGRPDCSIPFGYCHCGCGRKTKTAKHSNPTRMEFKGNPIRYIHGHHRTQIRINVNEISHFKINGEYCRIIALNKGFYAIVSECDYDELVKYNWHIKWDDGVNAFYASRNEKIIGKHATITMHRKILGLEINDQREADHVDPLRTLDNYRTNLRIANRDQQMRNREIFKSNTSGFKGVNRCPNSTSYRARIMANGVRIHLGVRKTAEAAWRELYVPAALKYYGKFARIK